MFEIVAKNASNCKIELSNILNEKFDENSVFIIDKNVFFHHQFFSTFSKILLVESNENIKSLNYLKKIYSFFFKNNITKDYTIYCVGGGTLCDLVGFATHSYLRGVNLTLIPTTLLSMADAAIGGKNALNFGKMKNAIGSFYLPKKVIIDISFLRTLPEEYYFSGLAEIIKIAILKSNELFQLLELNKKELIHRDFRFLEFIIKQAIKLKVDIVNKDFPDKNERLMLNFGHTFGHSIELVKNIPHGYAVAEGILYSLLISEKLEILEKNVKESVLSLLNYYNLLQYWDVKSPVFKLLLRDKKNNFDSIRMILLKDIEQPIIKTFKRDEFTKLIKNLFKY